MSASSHVTLWCDAILDDGERCVEFIEVGLPTARSSRQQAKLEGWVYRNGKDYCPKHEAKS